MDSGVPLQPDRVPRRAANASWRDIGGEMVILDTEGRVLRGLNATGGTAWKLADGSRTIADIARAIANETGADELRVQGDVVAFFEKLRAAGLLVSD